MPSRVNNPAPGRAGRPARHRATAVTPGNAGGRPRRRADGTRLVIARRNGSMPVSLAAARPGVPGRAECFPVRSLFHLQ